MSTQAIRRTLEELKDRLEDSRSEFFSRDQTAQDERRLEDVSEALAEVEAIERAAKDLSRLSVGDFTYSIRDRAAGDGSFSGNTWEHPDVKAWSDASTLVDAIAKEAK